MATEINLIGVYQVAGHTDVHLIELDIKAKHTDIPVGEFTQSQDGVEKDSWQVPWDEKYLNEQGTVVTGDFVEGPKDITDTTRLAFFLHHIDFSKPLITPFGDMELAQPAVMPERLATMIEYEQPD